MAVMMTYVFIFIILFSVISNTCERSYDGPYTRSHMCKLPQQPGVVYNRISRPEDGSVVVRSSEGNVPAPATVLPHCQSPFYHSSEPLVPMTCVAGKWDSTPVCKPVSLTPTDCGKSTYKRDPLSPRVVANRGYAPWNVIIYKKKRSRHKFVCQGTIINEDRVVSVAHCFWNESTSMLNNLDEYVVVAGKLNRNWGAEEDSKFEQISRISSGHITEYYRGRQANLQDDVIVLYLSEPFVFSENVHSVCTDYDYIFDIEQHREGANYSVAVWDYAVNHSKVNTSKLSIIKLPYVNVQKCYNDTEPIYYELLNSDKICAGYHDGSITLCPGASGSGLVSKYRDHYFLHGIVSVTTRPDAKHCGDYTYVICTHVYSHGDFLLQHVGASNPYVGKCVTPPTPKNGRLKLLRKDDSGSSWQASCDEGYLLAGVSVVSCVHGRWDQSVPLCTKADFQPRADQQGNRTGIWYEVVLNFKRCTNLNTTNFLVLILDYFICGHVNMYIPIRVIVLLVVSTVAICLYALFKYVPCLKRFLVCGSVSQNSFDTLLADSRAQSFASFKTLNNKNNDNLKSLSIAKNGRG